MIILYMPFAIFDPQYWYYDIWNFDSDKQGEVDFAHANFYNSVCVVRI